MNAKKFYNNLWSSNINVSEDRKILELRSSAVDYSYGLLGSLNGKRLLEIGCGAGFQTVEFSRKGAEVAAIDISGSSINATGKTLKENGLSAKVIIMDAEKLEFQDNFFDCVYINSVLMHVNKENVIKECSRVLKPGGKLIVLEPLKYSLLMPYRLFFSPYRETKPNYLTISEIKNFSKYFSRMEHREFYLSYIFLLPLFGKGHLWADTFKKYAEIADRLLSRIPLMNNFFWVSVACFVK